MILYRDMTYEEYEKIMENIDAQKVHTYFKGEENSYNYAENTTYMHFFKNILYAKMYLPLFGQMIVKCDIPDGLIAEEGYGFYRYKNYTVAIPIPECTINRRDFSADYITEINPSIRKENKCILGIKENKLYDIFLKKMYEEWKRNYSNMGNQNDFCYYVVDYLKHNNLDNILTSSAVDYLERTGKIRVKER